MRRTPDDELMDEADLDIAIQMHIDVHAHLVNQRHYWRPDSDIRHIAWGLCVTCREVIGESTFNVEHGYPLDLDDIPWSEHELFLLEHEYGVR